ncbi:secretin N-terminal domain-containing protein [Pseudidiomarina sp. CB1]|uniref:secretin N-terminal domain-containing protein n=1 Tax=Pseudidiomarina sp. CB1 TaxID=2972484 RepID=UPI0021631F99|nr:secretin N-terminal domain-containing protein [Pseudidiomarina sp. CB1]
MTQSNLKITIALVAALTLWGCAQTPDRIPIDPDRMEVKNGELVNSDDVQPDSQQGLREGGFSRLTSLQAQRSQLSSDQDPALKFSANDTQQMSANQLPMRAFIEAVFGKALQTNYIIASQDELNQTVTLNVSEAVSSRELFRLSRQLLNDNGLEVAYRDATFYIFPVKANQRGNVAIGLGRRIQDVPDTAQRILQVIPLKYGLKPTLERTLRGLTDVRLTAEMGQNAFFAEGQRQEILRLLDLIQLLDVPSTRGRYIAMVELTFISPQDYIEQLEELMDAEGISVGDQPVGGVALLVIPVNQLGAVAMFAADEEILDRAQFWTEKLDQPSRGAEKSYYIYHPRYARASDLGQSIALLIGGGSGGNTSRDTQSAQPQSGSNNQRTGSDSSNRGLSAGNEDMRMTVDERSNSIIFNTTGENYKSLLPVIRRLDVMPKQVVLDATIAEVTLTDEFAQGFEFAFRSGQITGGTLGALGVGDMGGFFVNWSDGVSSVRARLQQSSSLINVISNPTIVVRDGVAATINVGNDIPTIGSTTTNPNFESQTQEVVYRKTGVQMTVTPTINAQGLVVLQIDQTISNTSAGGPSVAGSPSIFERAIQTEVIAQSGQTILLGGLISESKQNGNSGVPGLSDIPLLGNLFKGKDSNSEKTELVIFITPRIIDSVDQWAEIRQTIAEGLTTIDLND